jgi:hypothetical protein
MTLRSMLLAVCLLAACGGDPPASSCDAHDPPDQATSALGCQGVAYCAVSCSGDVSCDTGCYQRGTPKAQSLTNQLAACVQSICVTASHRCTAYPGDNAPDCLTCAYAAVAGYPGGAACTPANDPACNKCGAQASACLSDL